MKFAWLPCSLILRQEQGSEKETAEVNTLKGLVVCHGRGKYSQKTLREAIAGHALRGVAITLFYGLISCIS